MYNVHELLEEMIKKQDSLESAIMYSHGYERKSRDRNKNKINELHIHIPKLKLNSDSIKSNEYNIFIRMGERLDITVNLTNGINVSTKLHIIDASKMIYKDLYNKLIDFAENTLQISVEEFTEETIKYFNDTSVLIPRSRISRFE